MGDIVPMIENVDIINLPTPKLLGVLKSPKCVLGDGQEIAVKRLQNASGHEQFMNEVLVIPKLQHNNLVRLLGCCIEGEEKLLVYEFMPNKSLDPEASKSLSWEKRFDIIHGIYRGLLYLHRDSRVKIIHRDLKTGNILLDANMNLKISDFRTAKIFDMNKDEDM
ncbi:G-type lectin S-receptor-like serine/threonine-protein kinase At1g11330 [Silene latifolia]|uniref:G-type lectin S-receptor-like serine/threonine-protein kinase At1g11330 n=1 Tax=Silene latifolia TaxID=37657 RepID=UPI003D771ACD